MENIFTPQEIAKFLHVAPTTIYAELKRGKLPHVRIGRKYLITRRHLEDYLSQDVVRELLTPEGQKDTSAISKTQIEAGEELETIWLDGVAHDMAQGIAAAEQDVSQDDLRTWLKEMEAAVKPLESDNA